MFQANNTHPSSTLQFRSSVLNKIRQAIVSEPSFIFLVHRTNPSGYLEISGFDFNFFPPPFPEEGVPRVMREPLRRFGPFVRHAIAFSDSAFLEAQEIVQNFMRLIYEHLRTCFEDDDEDRICVMELSDLAIHETYAVTYYFEYYVVMAKPEDMEHYKMIKWDPSRTNPVNGNETDDEE